MARAMDARGRVYEGGPLPLWAARYASRWCDGCQRPGLRGRTPTALGRTLILSYYKGRIYFLALPKCKTYADALYSMVWAAAPHLMWQDERIRAGILL